MKNNPTMQLDDLRVFSRVAELASFSLAADQLGLTKGRVSTTVQHLEAHVGARLLQRTTRSVRLTPDGEQFLERCKELLSDAEQLQAMFQPLASGLRGRVRVDMPTILARDIIIPRLPEFLEANPLLDVGIGTTDRRVDVIQEGYDCVLRIGAFPELDLVVRPLGAMPMCNLASPAYLRAHGTPTSLADLAQHRIIHFTSNLTTQGAGWDYVDNGTVCVQPMQSALVVNSADAYQAACIAGVGMIQCPVITTRHLVDAGLLVEVLPQFTATPMTVSLLYPHRRQIAPRVKAIMNWIAEVLKPHLTN
jgi:DNA-binding transcriptional LysR family regulator